MWIVAVMFVIVSVAGLGAVKQEVTRAPGQHHLVQHVTHK